jgi:hypothetical protein
MRKQAYPVTNLTGGLNVSLDPSLLEDSNSPEILEVRYDKGLLKKEFGLTEKGLPLLGIPMLLETFYTTVGGTYLLGITTTSAYCWNATTFEWDDVTQGVVTEACESAWVASASVTVTHPAGKVGTYCMKAVIDALFTTGLAAYKDISSADYTGYTHLHLLIKSSIATAAGDLQILLDNTSACASPLETLDIPALEANTWTRVSIALGTPANLTAVISVGLNVAVDNGAIDVSLEDIRAVKEFTGTQGNPFFSAVLIDTYVLVNGVDAPQKYSGTGTFATLGGSPPVAKTVCAFMSHLILGGVVEGSAYPQRVRWSSAGTVETWTGGTSGYVDMVDTVDWITHIKLLKNQCIVYKDYSIWELKYTGGTQVFLPEMKVNASGTLAPNTIIDQGEKHILFSNGNVVEFDGTYTKPISDKINHLLYITGENLLNVSKFPYATALYLAEVETYWLSFPYEEIIFKYDTRYDSWHRQNNFKASTLGYCDTGTSTPILWNTAVGYWNDNTYGSWLHRELPEQSPTTLIGWQDGQIYEDDRATSSSNELVWVTKDFLFGHAHRLTEVRFTFRYGGFTCYYSIDGGTTYVSLGTFGYAADFVEGVKYLNITTQRIRFKITTSEGQFELKWVEPWYIPRVRSKTLVDS